MTNICERREKLGNLLYFCVMKNRKLKNSELNRIDPDAFKQAAKTPIIIVLDNIRSLNNIGSIFRTADAFLIEKIYLCGITAKPPHKDIQKTALGATDSVSWEYNEDALALVNSLKKQGVFVASIEQAEQSISLADFQPENGNKYAIIFGNEVKGVQQEIVSNSDAVIEIPQFGTKHSLNISVSAGMVIWDLFAKLKR
jgi:23S rRNA (guanosine2251-2'-O)-methyltransferase